MGISAWQILIVFVVIGVIFGAGKLPQIGEGMGKAIRNFKKASAELQDSVEDITPSKKLEDKSGKDEKAV